MNEVKYEPIFGDQSLFHKEDAQFIIRGVNSEIIEVNELSPCKLPMGHSVEAMRRIIHTPKRWTRADKDAGRLPDVGCKCRQGSKDEIVVAVTGKFVVTECQDMSVCTTRNDVFIRSYKPIESPEEKAQRLEDEFINYVLHHEKSQINSSEELVAAKRAIKLAYKLQLSGELKAPGVNDEPYS